MAGISSKAAGGIQNKEKTFQGQRFDDDLGLNWLQFKWRNHDPQIGRFWQIDPLSDKYVYNSTFAFSENHVTTHVELEGLEKFPIHTEGDKHEIEKAQQKKWKYDYQEKSSSLNKSRSLADVGQRVSGKSGWGFYAPKVDANIEVGAVARVGVKGVDAKEGISVIFAGVKDNDPYFGGKNLNTGEVTLFNNWGGSFLGTGTQNEQTKVKDENSNYQLVSDKHSASAGLVLAFTSTIENNYRTNEQIETRSIDIGAGLGLGIVANFDLSIPIYQKTTKLK
jgi:RHS repeat-associated protein